MRAILSKSGHEVLPAPDAQTGPGPARRERPGLIFTDIRLPGMDGLETTRRLKQDEATRGIPTIAVALGKA